VTGANGPEWSFEDLDVERGEGGVVVPFPRGGRDGQRRGDVRWTFATSVRWVGDSEGEWLRHELASVLRDLLAWAREDITRGAGEKRAA
jgi:hypothetical protein